HRDAFARGEQHVELATVRIGRYLAGETEQLVGRVAHRRHDDDDVVPFAPRAHHTIGNLFQLGDVGDGGAAVFLDDDGHARLRCRMLRHGAHHVNSPSLSGSNARPRSTKPWPRIRSTIARSSGSWPIARGLRSFGWTSRSVRATFISPSSTSARPLAANDAAYASIAVRNCIFAGKSLPPFGTYTEATVTTPSGVARSTVTIRFS